MLQVESRAPGRGFTWKDLDIFEYLRGVHGVGVQIASATDGRDLGKRRKWRRKVLEGGVEGMFHGVREQNL